MRAAFTLRQPIYSECSVPLLVKLRRVVNFLQGIKFFSLIWHSGLSWACILLLAFALNMLILGTSSAGKLYKWVDEQGGTHFGSIPPPPQQMKEENVVIKEMSSPSSDRRKASSSQRVRGVWWAKKDGKATRRLKLSYDNFEVFDYSWGWEGVISKMVASGKYKLTQDSLALTYFEQLEHPEKLDQTERFRVSYIDDSKMTLLQDFVNAQVFKRQRETGSTNFSREIKGQWVDLSHRKYKFDHGTFFIYEPKNSAKRGFGNWEWEDPELTLDYVVDYVQPIDNTQGRMSRWIIQQRSYQEMTFVDQATGKTQILKRIK